ncbi:hypothetical protein TRICI_004946 [Trichomonascus ciferrii]|uniref:Protein YTP1-like C-terminal domain-containing protein n=1 Tax=Trichomonascus ciferrii TaxID=44093 RepID=A0A642V4J1_9ASCO|nr:hypothetical protein TRICI_004946 [Trichomonascus ciferrii]
MEARHEHHDSHIPPNEYVTDAPIDGILWAHIILMTITFGVIFPTGLVLGLGKSRWHVPCQILGGALTVVGYFLAHAHGGREFSSNNPHGKFAPYVIFLAIVQIGLGVVLKLHLEEKIRHYAVEKIRAIIVKVHLIIACIFPVVSWVQMGFGAITMVGFCHEDHLGQCLAHGIMGSSFIGYGLFLLSMLYVGKGMLERTNKSQEFYDSLIITLWGIVNTFTEHRWGQPWNHKDYQHTAMGIIWWCAGMVGIYLSFYIEDGVRRPRRNHIPALVMIFTGYAMSQHSQNLMISTKVHTMFGVMLMAAGVARMIEISFVLHDAAHQGPYIHAWQYLPPFLLVESGILFMGATEEQMALLDGVGIMHGSYILVMSSVAFLLFLLFLFLNTLNVSLKDKKGAVNADRPTRRTPGEIEMQPFLSDSD